jgi:hypothetical protein
MGKLEKLREINETINKLLIELETKLFVENICIDNTDVDVEPKENSIIKTN